jgi:hypothetical protein
MEGQRDTSGRGQRREPQAASSALAPQAIRLPKGGGAIRGIGEKLAVTPATGTASMTVPIATSPGALRLWTSARSHLRFGCGRRTFWLWIASLPLPSISTAMASPTC